MLYSANIKIGCMQIDILYRERDVRKIIVIIISFALLLKE